ncbi:MAG: hypothetical protein NTX06_00840, partial [Proteobacteria bacterium]|nr:hypothetical protein [Pseudomonadota bacterium]
CANKFLYKYANVENSINPFSRKAQVDKTCAFLVLKLPSFFFCANNPVKSNKKVQKDVALFDLR